MWSDPSQTLFSQHSRGLCLMGAWVYPLHKRWDQVPTATQVKWVCQMSINSWPFWRSTGSWLLHAKPASECDHFLARLWRICQSRRERGLREKLFNRYASDLICAYKGTRITSSRFEACKHIDNQPTCLKRFGLFLSPPLSFAHLHQLL